MANSRVKNSKRNIFSGILKQIISLVLAFVIRTTILYTLGAEYQGLNGLFTSILQVLNLTDLGFSTAVIFILYKPIAEGDTPTICAIVNFLKRIYLVIGILILALGLLIMPFLPRLVSSGIPQDVNLYILFLIYLINTSISYMMFAYKSALMSALQRQDVVNNVYTISTTAIKILQLLLLLLFHNYYIYIIVMPVGTIINNIVLQITSKKLFPQFVPVGTISDDIRSVFNKQIKSVFLGKISDVARNSFDNIVISAILGLVAVAVYDNYYYIYSALYGIMGIIIHGIMASVGNSIAVESVEKNYKDLQRFNFIFMWIVGWCTICMLCLYQPFMTIWMKGNQKMILSTFNMVLFCIYFYVINMTYVRSMYLDGNGLFHECRAWFVVEALGNLLLNFALGYFLGITGILLATIITIVVFNFICRTNILFAHYFKFSPKEFYFNHTLYAIITLIIGIITYYVCGIITIEGFAGLLLRGIICLVIPNILYVLFYRKTSQFPGAVQFAKRVLHR